MSRDRDEIVTDPLASFAEGLSWDEAPDAIAAVALADRVTFDGLILRFQATHTCPDRLAAVSLWSQLYLGTLIVPVVSHTAAHGRALPIDLSTRVSFCATTGVARVFRLTSQALDTDRCLGPLLENHVAPLIAILRLHSGLSVRLLWENAGWPLIWTCSAVAQTRPDLAPTVRAMLTGVSWPRAHPLKGIMTRASEGKAFVRRTCCLRYRIPGFMPCRGSCPLSPG